MSFARSRRRFLAARDRREEILQRWLRRKSPATVLLSLNIPGPRKNRAGTAALFRWAQAELGRILPALRIVRSGRDSLGPYAVIGAQRPVSELAAPSRRRLFAYASEAKRLCVRIESARPAARLVDLDVYNAQGDRIGRDSLGISPRRCLACGRPAAECIRLQRHKPETIVQIADEFLADLRA